MSAAYRAPDPRPANPLPQRRHKMKCPICRQPADPAFKPFCSKRCADVDLGKWVSGAYAIPGEPADVAEDKPASEEDQ